MQGKIMFALGAAVGYVVGTRSGRESYDRLKSQASEFWHDPRVQQKFSEAQEFAKEKMPVAGEKLSQATKKMTDRKNQKSGSMSGGSDSGGSDVGGSGAGGSGAQTMPSDTEPSHASSMGEGAKSNEDAVGHA